MAISLHSTILEDEYTSFIKEHYDYDPQRSANVTIPSFTLPKDDWNIIAIIGASGSGKSTILNNLISGGGRELIRPLKANHLLSWSPSQGGERASLRYGTCKRAELV